MAEDQPSRKIISREEAASLGYKKFFPGVSCHLGHMAEWYVADNRCCECSRRRSKKRYDKNPELYRTQTREWYKKNHDYAKQRARESNKRKRELASKIDSKHYVPAKPCCRGHFLRYWRTGLCVECAAINRKQWRVDNPVRTRELRREWAKKNPERERESHKKSNKKWHQKTRDVRRRKARENHLKHRERRIEEYRKKAALGFSAEEIAAAKERRDRWRKKHPDKVKLAAVTRSAHKRGNGVGQFTFADVEEIFELQRGKCGYCRRKLTVYDIDHIIALANGGPNVRRNIQLLCPKCNRRKGARDPIDHARSLGMLL